MPLTRPPETLVVLKAKQEANPISSTINRRARSSRRSYPFLIIRYISQAQATEAMAASRGASNDLKSRIVAPCRSVRSAA
jgi:hypothetical protein